MLEDQDQTMMEHLEELRRVLIISLAATFIMACVCWFFSDRILEIILQPVLATGNKMHYIGIMEALMTKIKLSFFMGFLLALPIILWQFWAFIMPALRKMERVYFTIFVVVSYLFFIGGILFAFYSVFNIGVKFLLHFGGEELLPMLTIGNYISFAMMFILPFGVIFELPLAVFLLAQLDIINYRWMVKKRKMAILISVVAGAVLVPSPDIITPLMMATPMYLLFELSASIVKLVEWLKRRKSKKQAAEEAQEESTEDNVTRQAEGND
ncbi:twin-arginine translocase subunit TatC [Desulforamulus hydrothermalis]|uniref:Sec-independent protein translocase protein TatC n=1 Tax=Desulforamulus hydrothermalis Lam5 = DSM 18033 TaxID=1121428 RepID=K8E0I7_9FIRM|nr:twin-arginine translocase subunit TatC [Desulforamulus hydrothermalis]CCO08975.1 Sec-independent protein translocase protein TatC [Desulforamulus hydrothermalis Lam5 = DSM 18033]SHG76075.1 Sec-independent protein translocase TatC [Desulforamulus hydrothermalis Lam5 = DSM 18033]